MDVLTIGEVMACFAPDLAATGAVGVFRRSVGGAEANTAIGLARLGDSVAWISRVSTDPLGEAVLDALRTEGVDVSRVVAVEDAQTGLMLKERVDEHEVRVFYYRAGSAASALQPGDVPDDAVRESRLFHVTGVTLALGEAPRQLAIETAERASEGGSRVTFDLNFRPKLTSADGARRFTHEILPFVDDFLCNESEAELLTGRPDPREAAVDLARRGPGAVIVKRGVAGAIALVDGALLAVPAAPAPAPVDPVGAGDAFNAGWIHGRLHGLGPATAIELAAFVTAGVVQHPGDYEGFPDRRTTDGWLAARAGRDMNKETAG